MNILLILHEHLLPNSGSAGSTLSLGKQYELMGHSVRYYSFDDLPKKMSLNVKDAVFPEYVAFYLQQLLSRESLDIIDASTGDIWVWGKFLRNKHKKMFVVTRSHGLDHLDHFEILEDAKRGDISLSWKYPLYRGSLQLWEVKNSLKYCDAVFMLNRREASYATEHLSIQKSKVHVFPNGMPDNFLNLPFEPTPMKKDDVIRVAQIGTYIARKGIFYSTPALNNILMRYPNIQVSLIGTELRGYGKMDDVYTDFEPSVRDRVNVIPYFEHKTLPDLLKGHHIKLFPTLAEGFGKALIEAMACGLAPITTLTPGPTDIVQEGYDAMIVPTRKSRAIEIALEELINDRLFLDQLRQNAYSTAQRYSWKTIAQNRMLIYEDGLSKRG